MTAELGYVYCPSCCRDCCAEIPPCPDGHGDRCPDRACVECGTALLWDIALFEPARRAHRSRRPRRAA